MEVVVGEHDLFGKEVLGIILVMSDDTGMGIGVEHAGIQEKQTNKGSYPMLPGFEDDVQVVHPQV
jgi:hypothetical protein